jgi:hypothetical protein
MLQDSNSRCPHFRPQSALETLLVQIGLGTSETNKRIAMISNPLAMKFLVLKQPRQVASERFLGTLNTWRNAGSCSFQCARHSFAFRRLPAVRCQIIAWKHVFSISNAIH